MIGLISRLTDQKGLDLINAVMDGLVDDYTQLVALWNLEMLRMRSKSRRDSLLPDWGQIIAIED